MHLWLLNSFAPLLHLPVVLTLSMDLFFPKLHLLILHILWCATSRRQHQIPQTPTRAGYNCIMTARSVRTSAFTWMRTPPWQHTSPSPHQAVSHPCARSVLYGNLLQDQSCCRWSSLWSCHNLAGSPSYMFDKLQSVLNTAARLIFSKRRFESVTPLPRDLHWLRVPERVEYKLSVLVYRCLHNLASEYLCDELRRVADLSSRQRLRSSSTSALIIPPTRLSTVGDRAFPTAASRIWNSLPLHFTSAPSLYRLLRRGWSRFCSAAVSRPNSLYPITDATLFSA